MTSDIRGTGLLVGQRFGEELIYVDPECPERGPFLFGQLGQLVLVADAGEVGVSLPVLEGGRDLGLHDGRTGVEELGPRGEFGLEPFAGLSAELGLGGVIGRRIVLALAGRGERGGAGGVVAVSGFAVVGELGVMLQCLGVEPGRRQVERPVISTQGKLDSLGRRSWVPDLR